MPGIDFSGFVDGIMPAFQQMAKSQKEKEAYKRQLAQVEQWSKMGIENGQMVPIVEGVKNKNIIPFINQKAIDDIKSNRTHSIAQKRGELDAAAAIMRMNAQNAIRQAAKEPKTQTAVPGLPGTYNLTEAQRLQAAQNAAAAQRAQESGKRAERGMTLQEQSAAGTQPVQQKRFDLADAKEQRKILEAQPEYKFQQKHGITPAKIMENPYEDYTLYGTDPQGQRAAAGWNITRDPSGKLVGQGAVRSNAIMPPGYVPGKTKAEDVAKFQKQFYYQPNSPIYRATKSEYSAKDANDTTVKGVAYTPDPEGDVMNVHGQYMPINEYEGIKQRALTMKESYLNKITYDPNSGEKVNDYNKRVAGLNQYMLELGYDPKQFLGQ